MRMTLQEMRIQYPNQWLGLANVEETAKGSVISADVVYTDKTASELARMSIRNEGIMPFFTTPDSTFHVGAIM